MIRPVHLILAAAILLGLWLTDPFSTTDAPVDTPRVSLAIDREQPMQRTLSAPAQVAFEDYQLTLLAEFALDARVLGRENYRFGREADLSPWDFALGWGEMSRPEVADQFDIRQSGRWYYWQTKQLPIPKRQVEISSANMHMIPANDQVREQLERVTEHDQLRLRGFLVEARGEDGWRWRSSLSREDTGNGACELILVTEVL
ncbi:MAG: hypothetical protein GYB41_06055 [Oceanospirillales bacterium]|uniref:Uncharacterized protein n=1 Tax=Marinobacterium halophilum TaxID=267374 RepID=A0A2P8EKQ0_9GAMM|nr:hypothetical protein [Marinobacterium halophilum]MBR9828189.1 hypothetical protein [Oceanospirillales bacterium]PSL10018.1 hypothetical protein CLV44_12844 [Marinobacterium halophilum]